MFWKKNESSAYSYASKWYFGDESCTQMDENYTEDVNFASIINKFQVYDIAS